MWWTRGTVSMFYVVDPWHRESNISQRVLRCLMMTVDSHVKRS